MASPEQYIIHFTDPSSTAIIVSPYTSNGKKFPVSQTLDSDAVSADTSLLIYGRGSANYGERIQENILHILENFSGATPPELPISGQLWFSRKEYWRGASSNWYRWNNSTSSWDIFTVTYSQPGDPGSPANGIYWFNDSSLILYRRVNDLNHPLHNTWVPVNFVGNGTLNPSASVGSPLDINDAPELILKVYDGSQWRNVENQAFASDTAPSSPSVGSLWYDTDPSNDTDLGISQLKVWTGSAWVSSGGNYVNKTGDTMTGDLTMISSSINIDASQGLIGNVAGSPLGDGATLKVSSDGNTWEVQSGATNTNAFIVKNSVGALVLTVGITDADLTSTFAGGIVVSSGNELLGLPALPSGITAAASKKYVDDVVAIVSGGTPASINDLLDVYLSTPTHNEFLYYDNVGSPTGQWKNRTITLSDISEITTSATQINYLDTVSSDVQLQLNLKSPLASPTFTGTPSISGATPPASTDNLQIATTAFVQDAIIAGGVGGGSDGVLISASWGFPTNYQLDLQTSDGGSPLPLPIQVDLTHTHPSTEITHTFVDSVLRDAFVTGGSPEIVSATIEDVVEQLSLDIHRKTSRQLKEQIILRQVARPVANQTNFLLDNDEGFLGGYNRLQVFVNGIKQYANEQARQAIYLRYDFNVSPTAPTGLPDDATSYSFTVAVDGGGAQTVTVAGSQVQTVQGIIDQINSQVTGATSIFDPRWVGIFVFSDTSGNGSSISITDVDFFSALAAVSATTSLPVYDTNNIFPDYPSNITQITNDGAYYEATVPAGSPISYVQATAGSEGIAVVFNTPVPSGAVVEFLIT